MNLRIITCLCLALFGTARAQIPPQDLASALQAFGQQHDLLVIFVNEDVRNLKSHAVEGNLAAEASLQQLLDGTGLTYQYLDSQTVSIVPSKPRPPAQAAHGKVESTNEAIVIGAHEYGGKELETVLDEFVKSHGALTVVAGKVARWGDGVCPITIGLSPGMNAYISRRVGQVAKSVGVPRLKVRRCQPNIEVIFTQEPQKVLDYVARVRIGMLLGFHYNAQRNRMKTFKGPIQAWYLTTTGSGWGEALVDHPRSRPPTTQTASRLKDTATSSFANVLIVADANKIVGHNIGPIADYVAMLALSQAASLEGCDDLPSIIDLMAENCARQTKPQALTASDTAYLKALYAVDSTWPAALQRSHVTTRMKNEIVEKQ